MSEWSLFKTFNDPALADELAQLLEKKRIPFQKVKNEYSLDTSFSFSDLNKDVQILLLQSDFERAYAAIDDSLGDDVNNAPSDHYLFNFNTEELHDILANQDEWCRYDVLLATRILKEQGEDHSAEDLKDLRDLKVATSKDNYWSAELPVGIAVGCLVFSYFILRLPCLAFVIMIGWFIWRGKRTLGDGTKAYGYSTSNRRIGMVLFIIGLLCLCVDLILYYALIPSEMILF